MYKITENIFFGKRKEEKSRCRSLVLVQWAKVRRER